MEMNEMVFKYAKSPKDEYSTHSLEDLISCNFEDHKRTKPLKIKNQKSNANDLKYILYLVCRKRTFVLSARTRQE